MMENLLDWCCPGQALLFPEKAASQQNTAGTPALPSWPVRYDIRFVQGGRGPFQGRRGRFPGPAFLTGRLGIL